MTSSRAADNGLSIGLCCHSMRGTGDDLLEVKNFISYEKRARTNIAPGMHPQFIKQNNFEANSANTFTLADHKLTLGVNFTRNELNDTLGIADKQAPGVTPVSKITRHGWAVFAGRRVDDRPGLYPDDLGAPDHDSYRLSRYA